METKCRGCGRGFVPPHHLSRFCSPSCKLGRPLCVYHNMLNRCLNEDADGYESYGGRGILVCLRWQLDSDNFFADMGPRPPGHQLDRIDPEGHYCPENCRWASLETQHNNKRNTRLLTLNGETLSASQWGRRLGAANSSTIMARLRLGWSEAKALSTPIAPRLSRKEIAS